MFKLIIDLQINNMSYANLELNNENRRLIYETPSLKIKRFTLICCNIIITGCSIYVLHQAYYLSCYV